MDIEIYCDGDLLDISDSLSAELYDSYQLPVISETVVISDSISPVFFIRCQLIVFSCQLSNQILLTSISDRDIRLLLYFKYILLAC